MPLQSLNIVNTLSIGFFIVLLSCSVKHQNKLDYELTSTKKKILTQLSAKETQIIFFADDDKSVHRKLDSLSSELGLPYSREYLRTSSYFYRHQPDSINASLHKIINATEFSNPIHQLSLIRMSRILHREGRNGASSRYANRAYYRAKRYQSPVLTEAIQNLILSQLEVRNLQRTKQLLKEDSLLLNKMSFPDFRNRHKALVSVYWKNLTEDQYNQGEITLKQKKMAYKRMAAKLEEIDTHLQQNKVNLRYMQGSLGSVYLELGDTLKAYRVYKNATSNLKPNRFYDPTLLLHKSKLLIYMDSLDAAESELQKLDTLIRVNDLDSRVYYLHNKYKLLSKREDYEEASKVAIKLSTALNQLNNGKMQREAAEASARYKNLELRNKNNKLALTNTRKQRYLISLSALLIIVPGLIFFVGKMKQMRFKKERAIIESELRHKLFNSQMNPHFIFNSLSSISALVSLKEEKKAKEFIYNFSLLMRRILESSQNEVVSLQQEIGYLENYLSMQRVRFDGEIEFVLDYSKSELTNFKLPPLTLQPLVENCIIHAFHGVFHKKKIIIRCKADEKSGRMFIQILDNGIGLDSTEEKGSKHRSISTQLIERRFEILEKKYKKTFHFIRQNRTETKGTEVLIEIEAL